MVDRLTILSNGKRPTTREESLLVSVFNGTCLVDRVEACNLRTTGSGTYLWLRMVMSCVYILSSVWALQVEGFVKKTHNEEQTRVSNSSPQVPLSCMEACLPELGSTCCSHSLQSAGETEQNAVRDCLVLSLTTAKINFELFWGGFQVLLC